MEIKTLVVKYITKVTWSIRWLAACGRSYQPQAQWPQSKLENWAEFHILDHSCKLSLLGGMSEKNTIEPQEKAYFILPSDLRAIWLSPEGSKKVIRRKVAFWVEEGVSSFPGRWWNRDYHDHLQRNTGTRLSATGHEAGLIRSRETADFWYMHVPMILTATYALVRLFPLYEDVLQN